jgi:class 3 adenylate cyclase/tetratricopeptide (TPR) repeat protein
MTGPSDEDLLRFLPGALVEWVRRTPDSTAPSREEHVGALMITDISGFTRLTAKLARDGGEAGAERLSRLLNAFVAELVGAVEERGGVILSFEGDSLLAGWEAQGGASDLATAVWRCCHCASVLQTRVGDATVEGEPLTVRSGVAAGTINLIHLRSQSANRRVVLTGPCVSEVSQCAALAESREVLVSSEAFSYVSDHAKGRATEGQAVHLLEIADPPPVSPHLSAGWSGDSDRASYLPLVVRSRLGSSLSRWLAELRTVTALFIRITGADLLDSPEQLEAAVNALQAKITRFHGDVLRITTCEGGIQALVVFGLPGYAHHDDPRRASLAALELQPDVSRLGLHLSVGIATGDAFCGAIGTARRAEYTVLGEAVNRAARLSALAAGRTLADDVTAQAASAFVSYQGPWSMNVPGLRVPIPTYIAGHPKHEGMLAARDLFVGRAEELQRLNSLVRPADGNKARAILVEGEPGVGKSALVEAFAEGSRATGVAVLNGLADDVERATPYFAFRRIIRQLLGVEQLAGREAYEAILTRLKQRRDQTRFIPLLDDVLDLGLEQTPTTNALSGPVRSDNLRGLLKTIILDGLRARPSILVIEDAHWLDVSSVALLAELMRSGEPVAVVLTARTGHRIEGFAGLDRLSLKPLSEADTAELVSSSLGQPDTPVWLQQAIWERTGGNPFFIGEICRVIKQRRPETRVRIVPHPDIGEEGSLVALPQSARAAVLSRTDLLLPDEQFVLKIASAVAASFTAADLEAIDLIKDIGVNVAQCVANLARAHLIRATGGDPSRFMFAHAITREVVYSSMVSEQRREAHTAIARSLERGALTAAETLPLVLNQWQRAGDRSKVFEYVDRVAELRLRQFDNAAAIALVEEFFGLARDEGLSPPPGRQAAAYFIRGEAELNLGRMKEARAAYEAGLRLLKLPLPQSSVVLALRMIQQIVVHLARSRRRAGPPSGRKSRSAATSEAVLKAARVHEDLTRIYYFQGDKARLLYATLRATNLAEGLAELSPVLVANYASLGSICGVIPLRRPAERYLRLARGLSEQVNAPDASILVDLLTGMYETSIGEWQAAREHFEPGLERAIALGDKRRWSELAVCLETILSPCLFNISYRGEAFWRELVDNICKTGRDTGNLHVLGCGLAGAMRGHRTLGSDETASNYLAELATFLQDQPETLEPIHRLEAAAFLADAALARGDLHTWQHWLQQANRWMSNVAPSMKSRTLPALTAVFRSAMTPPRDSEPAGARVLRWNLATESAANFKRFAGVYPIGRPRAFLVRGDLEASLGHGTRAAKLWRQALADAMRLKMPADALASTARLRTTTAGLRDADMAAANDLEKLFLAHDAEWRKTAERSAAVLGAGDYGGDDRACASTSLAS